MIGALFRSTKYQRRETELIVLITPKLVEAINPGQVGDLPGSHWRNPSEAEMFFNGDVGGDHQADEMRDWTKKTSERGPADKTSQFTATAGTKQSSDGTTVPTDAVVSAEENPADKPTTPPLFFGDAGFAAPVGSTRTSAKAAQNNSTSASASD